MTNSVPEPGSRYPDIDPLTGPLVDPPMCINCNLPVPEFLERPWKSLAVVLNNGSGTVETQSEWPLCPDCETTTPDGLMAYVKYALS